MKVVVMTLFGTAEVMTEFFVDTEAEAKEVLKTIATAGGGVIIVNLHTSTPILINTHYVIRATIQR